MYAAGQVTVLRGGRSGLTGNGAYSISQNTKDVPGTAEQNDFFGADTVLLDVNGDGRADCSPAPPARTGTAASGRSSSPVNTRHRRPARQLRRAGPSARSPTSGSVPLAGVSATLTRY